jgi:hypothetical protein
MTGWAQAGCVFAAVLFWAAAASTHDWYEGVQLEREGMEPLDCCGEKDCAPIPIAPLPESFAMRC